MTTFNELELQPAVLKAVTQLGYETPTPIQAESIPILLNGQDLLAQAQTGTGKTAAFALPILTKLNLRESLPQILVLAPTRELAIQVAEAFQSYAKYLKDFHVLPIYGGQAYSPQLKALKRGAHVIVGTPGRVMDHLRRGSLVLDKLKTIVLDEADEMLNMGFIEDIEWILEQIPTEHQTALFSATMPPAIKKIAQKYLRNAEEIKIKPSERTVDAIKQYCVMVNNQHKLDALTRFLEIEEFGAAIIFTRTKTASSELAEKLEARGYSAAAINGDMAQPAREKVIKRLKQGNLDIIVATEVAARGLDVERIGFVINYDIPHDVESYVHRIGRTGRAGREGKSLVFVAPREHRMLREIEHFTKQKIQEIKPPSRVAIKEKRLAGFAQKVDDILVKENLDKQRTFIASLLEVGKWNESDIAAALAYLLEPKGSKSEDKAPDEIPTAAQEQRSKDRSRRERRDSGRERNEGGRERNEGGRDRKGKVRQPESGMVRCRMELGQMDKVTPSDVVGLIANKCNLNRKHVGQIHIFDKYSLVDVSKEKVDDVVRTIQKCKLKQRETRFRVFK